MIINYYLCPSIAYYSSFAPSMIHSMHHMIIILYICINIIIKYMITKLYLHIAAPATIAHTYPLLPYPLLDTICSLYRFYHIVIILYIIYKYYIINTFILPRLLMMIMSIHCSLIAPSMIDRFHHNIIIIKNPNRTTS